MQPVAIAVLSALVCVSCRAGETEREVGTDRANEPESVGAADPGQPASDPEPSEPPPEPRAPPETTLGVVDRGIFSDLDARMQIPLPTELEPSRVRGLVDHERALLVLYVDDWPRKVYPLAGERVLQRGEHALALRPGDHGELAHLLTQPEQLRVLAAGTSPPPGDRDGDGIPDPVDLWLGIRKVELDAATYDDGYHEIDFPGGDVPRDRGACVDVIVRALRNVGVDLQAELYDDIRAHPRRYPMVERANPSIDHRRVRTVLPWFRAHWLARSGEPSEAEPWRAGEVVFMETMASRSGSDHIGWIFEPEPSVDPERPLVVNAWTEGYATEAMDLLAWVPVTERFALPPAPAHAGPIPAWTRKLVLVIAGDAAHADTRFRASARRLVRHEVGGAWQVEGERFDVVLGHGGVAWGVGLHGDGAPAGVRGPVKREGDGRTPAGVFALGRLYGRAPASTLALPYAAMPESLRCVDDPGSSHYGEIVASEGVSADWRSAEDMPALYEYALVVEHNGARTAGRGSCIFVHAWRDADTPVTGCTAMHADVLDELLGWLEPGALLVVLPGESAAALVERWGLATAS
jgi:uncharacterized protein YijF (DUF1287 family)/L,D-peptidoglycan transpeptidase YkuD (ErfK/YbiS/YcfS/YnhG family)